MDTRQVWDTLLWASAMAGPYPGEELGMALSLPPPHSGGPAVFPKALSTLDLWPRALLTHGPSGAWSLQQYRWVSCLATGESACWAGLLSPCQATSFVEPACSPLGRPILLPSPAALLLSPAWTPGLLSQSQVRLTCCPLGGAPALGPRLFQEKLTDLTQ